MVTVSDIEKKLAKAGLTRIIRNTEIRRRHVPTGILMLDLASLGGDVLGQYSEYIGIGGAGKSTLQFKRCANFQRAFPNKIVVYIDAEQAIDDIAWVEKQGVDLNKFLLLSPETSEMAVDLVDEYMRAEDVSLVVFDSVPALGSAKHMEKQADENNAPAINAKLMQNLLVKATNALAFAKNSNQDDPDNIPTLVFNNYWRTGMSAVGSWKVRPGGNQYFQMLYWSIALTVGNKNIKEGQDNLTNDKIALWNKIEFDVEKTKIGGSIRESYFKMIRDNSHPGGAGYIDQMDDIWEYGTKLGLISGGGSSYKIPGLGLSGKKADLIQQIEFTPELYEPLYHEILCRNRERHGLPREGWRVGEFIQIDWPDVQDTDK